jgi:hypothetical protein
LLGGKSDNDKFKGLNYISADRRMVETDGRVVATISSHLKELQLMGKLGSLLG